MSFREGIGALGEGRVVGFVCNGGVDGEPVGAVLGV